MTEQQLEDASREYCAKINWDPDEVLDTGQKRWEVVKPQLEGLSLYVESINTAVNPSP